ncbi:MAG TPA: hypothetical protein ENK28_07335 [Aliiroseovarius sp.]|nr:hypothetical protein [Aliiroseovarius sp.]
MVTPGFSNHVAVVAGNGPSLANMSAGRILAEDFIIRTNNFFFEPQFFLGRRVDLAFMGGDARVAPFMFETLFQCRQHYGLEAWASHNPEVAAAGLRRFPGGFQPMKYRTPRVQADIAALAERFGKMPTTGVQALIHAHGLGGRTIILAGFDFYQETTRYMYVPGQHQLDLLGADLAHRGADRTLHDPDLDLAVIAYLQDLGDVRLYRSSQGTALDELLDLAPPRKGKRIVSEPRPQAPQDWATRSGLYPIGVLKALRRASACLRRPRLSPAAGERGISNDV